MPLVRPPASSTRTAIDSVASDLDRRIKRFIGSKHADDAAFERLALDIFAYQYAANEPYRRYCDRFGRTPNMVDRWLDIPAVPTSAFAHARFACFPPERTKVTFRSSGTTHSTRSTLELEDVSLYDASLLAHFRRMVLPDLRQIRLIVLAPPFPEARDSSLSYMLSKISEVYGTGDDGFYIRGGELDFDGALAALRSVCAPVLVVGTAFAFVHFFDRCAAGGIRLSLPEGSRVVETGGFKGRSRVVAQPELYRWFTDVLGVPRDMCVSEYGMCELGSQWYDDTPVCRFPSGGGRLDAKVGPHWTRAQIVDRVSAQPLHHGGTGLLQVFDLSNRGSVSAVLTGDLAEATHGGFQLIGRAPGELPKGCSIAVDAALGRA